MSLAYPPPLQDRRPSGGNTVTLASNNPFRRAISPAEPSANLPPNVSNGNRQPSGSSANPFNDTFQTIYPAPAPMQRQKSPTRSMQPPNYRYQQPPRQVQVGGNPAELMRGLNLNDKSASDRNYMPRGPPPPSTTFPISNHRHNRSQDETLRARNDARSGGQEVLNIFATPPKNNDTRRSRRNSESSVFDAAKDELRIQKELRRRERDGKAGQSKSRAGRSSKSKRPNPHMDVIDKLDVTSIYGTGLFHHDGPFDACNPQRNRLESSAPMKAFAEGSANNTMGGSGPVNKAMDIDRYHGRGDESFSDFNVSAPTQALTGFRRPERIERIFPENGAIVDPKRHTEPVHGEETLGLGTSTFLEGTPAPSAQRDKRRPSELAKRSPSELEYSAMAGPGLQRKKSLAQKIRGISKPRQGFGDAGRVISPDARYIPVESGDFRSRNSPPSMPGAAPRLPMPMGQTPPMPVGYPQSAGGRTKMVEVNPFFSGDAAKKEMSSVQVTSLGEPKLAATIRNRTVSSPQNPLFRTKTNESVGEVETKSGGLLSRVRSMRGGRRREP